MFLYLGGVWTPPHLYTPIHSYTPIFVYTPIGPQALLCTCMVLENLHVVGVVICFHMYWDTSLTHPYLGVPPLNCTPNTPLLVPCALLFSGILVSCVGLSPSIEGFGFVPPSLGEVWGAHQLFSCPHAHSCTFFVVHYVSHLDHGSNYYSSSYSGIFWPVISVISDSGSFPDRVSSKPWHGSTTTLDAEGLWRCS